MLKELESIVGGFSSWVWGVPLVSLLIGGGAFLLFYSRFLPFRYLFHAIDVVRGRYDDPEDPGDISHFQALSSALAATIGMGNIAGVAVAIYVGGPGAVFWMWVSAFVGIVTKFFTCTLAVMYRSHDTDGQPQGGPMYVIVEGLGERWKPLAVFFATTALIGSLPAFQVNQLVQVLRDVVFIPNGWVGDDQFTFNLIAGLAIAGLVASVIFGGILRIGKVASTLVPAMVLVYMSCALWILVSNAQAIPGSLWLIVSDAFSGQAAAGGMLGVMLTGVQRAAFSNEAGIGTAPLAHGAAKTTQPVREGLVAMLGPAIDTLVVCTITALLILVTGVWQGSEANGITLTANAFEHAMPGVGPYLLILCVVFFSTSTIFTYSYYGSKCLGFLIGTQRQGLYNYFYVAVIVISAVVSLNLAVGIIDSAFALMAIPTMVSTLLLAPRVMQAARTYFVTTVPTARIVSK